MYKLVYVKDDPKFIYIENLNSNSNKMPTPYSEVTWHDFVQNCFTYSAEFTETRYITQKDFTGYVTIFYFFNNAYALTKPSVWRVGNKDEPRIVYEDSPRYFRIGCEHEYAEIRESMHVRNYRCTKCQLKFSQDSSG